VGSATGAEFDHGSDGREGKDEQPLAKMVMINAPGANISVLIENYPQLEIKIDVIQVAVHQSTKPQRKISDEGPKNLQTLGSSK
jgi:hypothetical protein